MMHPNIHVNELSNTLLKAATKGGALALGLPKGELRANKDADIILLTLPDIVEKEENLSTNIILHTKKVDKTIIGGKYV